MRQKRKRIFIIQIKIQLKLCLDAIYCTQSCVERKNAGIRIENQRAETKVIVGGGDGNFLEHAIRPSAPRISFNTGY